MKRKRLDRDSWGFTHFPYAQVRLDRPDFHGWAVVLRLESGDNCYWDLPRAGHVAVCGAGMTWLTLIPDGRRSILTAKFRPNGRVALWYADMIAETSTDPDGVLTFTDQYLDVIFTPQGDVKLDDADELRAACAAGELTRRQYWLAWLESWRVRLAWAYRPKRTETWCRSLLEEAFRRAKEPGNFTRNW